MSVQPRDDTPGTGTRQAILLVTCSTEDVHIKKKDCFEFPSFCMKLHLITAK